MRQLYSCPAALIVDEAHDACQGLNVIILPDAQILRTDASVRQNCSGLSEEQTSAANCAAAKVDKMPVIRISITARILAHGRHRNAVRKRHATNREGIEQMGHDLSSMGDS